MCASETKSNHVMLRRIKHQQEFRKTLKIEFFGAYLHLNNTNMARQTLNIHEPNDLWLNKIVETKEYSSKSELVNDLIRQARKQWQDDFIRRKIELAEQSGFSTKTQAEILEKAKSSDLGSI